MPQQILPLFMLLSLSFIGWQSLHGGCLEAERKTHSKFLHFTIARWLVCGFRILYWQIEVLCLCARFYLFIYFLSEHWTFSFDLYSVLSKKKGSSFPVPKYSLFSIYICIFNSYPFLTILFDSPIFSFPASLGFLKRECSNEWIYLVW